MIAVAIERRTVTYSQLLEKVTSISLDPQDLRVSFLLDEISREENAASRGMLTAVVVHKHDYQPGEGFFKLATALGRNTSCRITFWIEELNAVHKFWKQDAVGQCFLLPVHAAA